MCEVDLRLRVAVIVVIAEHQAPRHAQHFVAKEEVGPRVLEFAIVDTRHAALVGGCRMMVW